MEEWLDFQDMVDRVHELIDLGLFEEATELLESGHETAPDSWEVPFLYSRIYLEQNKPEESIPFLMKALRIDRTNVDVLLGLFYAWSQLDRLLRAGRFLFLANKYHPDSEAVQSGLIWYYTETTEFAEAIAVFERARSQGCSEPDTFRNAGVAYQRVGDYGNAETCFKTALELNPQFDEVRDLLADQYLWAEETDKAIAIYRDHLKASPRNIRSLSRLVYCLSQAEKDAEAEATAVETIRLYPNSTVGYVDLAYVHLNAGSQDKAVAAAEQALAISPIDAEAMRVKAIALSEKNETAAADSTFQHALELDPENPEIMRDYYHHLRSTNDFDKMERMVNTVISLEQPYCVEDYWFLADYYREKRSNLTAFHYLHRAFESMPGENGLIPPMVDIMLDEGHTSFAVPFMLAYVDRTGWDDTMNTFSRHKRLRGGMEQESLRFLRYYAQRPVEFRQYALLVYARRYLPIALLMLFPALAVFFALLWKIWGIALAGSLCVGVLIGFSIPKLLVKFGMKKKEPPPPAEDLSIKTPPDALKN